MKQFRAQLTYANVVATIALVIAIGGGSFAVAKTAKIGTKQLKNGAVTPNKLADGAVLAKLPDRSIGPRKLADGAVGARQLATLQTVSNPTGFGITCPSGTKLISGGITTDGQILQLVPHVSDNDWSVSTTGGTTRTPIALCLSASD